MTVLKHGNWCRSPVPVRGLVGVLGISTKHFYADGLQVAKMVNGAVYYLHEDALGSVRLVATATVTIAFSSNYIPYGQSYGMSGKEVFMYTGKPYDSTTGLYYYGARYYDDSIGRFVTEDSYGGDANDPMSLNRYIYAEDNPMKLVDADGNSVRDPHRSYELVSLLIPFITLTWIGLVPIISVEWMVMVFSVLRSGTTSTNPNNGGSSPNTSCQRGDVHCLGTSTATTTLATVTAVGGNEVGAWLVVGFLGVMTVASGLATVATSPLALTGIGAVVPAFFASTTIGLAYSTWDAGEYTYTSGPNATPEGAFASTPLDVILQWLSDIPLP